MSFKVINYFDQSSEQKTKYLQRIYESDWDAGKFLHEMLSNGTFFDMTGEGSKILLLIDQKTDQIASYCTYAKKDDVPNTELTPWMGFVYTYPEYRGQHLMWYLFDHVTKLCEKDRYKCFYISTGHEGLYEKYGCVFQEMLPDMHGGPSRIYRKEIKSAYLHKANTWANGLFLGCGIGLFLLVGCLIIGVLLSKTPVALLAMGAVVVGSALMICAPLWGILFFIMGIFNAYLAKVREHRLVFWTVVKLFIGLLVTSGLFTFFLKMVENAASV